VYDDKVINRRDGKLHLLLYICFMKQSEHLQEGWVYFHRLQCRVGFIDYWMGDAIDNPNKQHRSPMALNASRTYFRLNGAGEWLTGGCFDRIMNAITHFHKCSTAEEIWNEYRKDPELKSPLAL